MKSSIFAVFLSLVIGLPLAGCTGRDNTTAADQDEALMGPEEAPEAPANPIDRADPQADSPVDAERGNDPAE
ncbi:hypothetical protein ACXYTJ_06740 [Gilvimarinus sp. F26214L]|uniref:hypothetical protein n=1 Tax=Gilvimarinus sp. DZF01 TaxID=3461371 RepID=UPI00404552D1